MSGCSTTGKQTDWCMFDLPSELLLLIFSFQTAKEFCYLISTCRKLYFSQQHSKHLDLLLQEQWKVYCSMRWGINKADVKNKFPPKSLHLRVLYPLTYPLPIAQSSRQDSGKTGLSRVTSSDHLHISEDGTNLKVSFTGVVGVSTRSIQSNLPFPPLVNTEPLEHLISNPLHHILYHIWRLMFNANESRIGKHSTPFVYNEGSSRLTCINPRNISYYEVTIRLSRDNTSSASYNNLQDCVAVGLSAIGFERHKRLPGWDDLSYGYHSDDGAIYHGKGRRLCTYGPTFGVGDIIGCGVNHQERSIFFTLNGKFLNYAFTNLQPGLELYPTVGIDMTNGSVEFNFGNSSPFLFDLLSFIQSDEEKHNFKDAVPFPLTYIYNRRLVGTKA